MTKGASSCSLVAHADDDRHSQLTMHAMGAAIPHAMQLLFALLDILPFPRQHMYHEIRTTSVQCVDEVGQPEDDEGDGIEEDEVERRTRIKVCYLV